MKRALAIALLVATTRNAGADSIKPPAGWTADTASAVSLSKRVGDLPQFGGLRAIATTEVYQGTGASLFVTRMSASIAGMDAAARNKAASAQLDEIITGPIRRGKVVTDSSNTRDSDRPHAIEGTHRWHDDSTHIASNNRIVIAADAQQIVAVIGECLLSADVKKDADDACAAALTTLDPGIAPASRVDLAIVKDTTPIAPPPAPSGTGGPAMTGPSLVESGERPSLPPMQIPQEKREADRRPVYVGIGLVVLAIIFYWNRKNREKLEREYEKRVDSTKPAKPADRDADDLHAAANEDSGTKESKS